MGGDSDRKVSQKASSTARTIFMFLLAMGFMSTSTMVLYQRKLIAETSTLTTEWKTAHDAGRHLRLAVREKDMEEIRQREISAAIKKEMHLLQQAEQLAKKHKKDGGFLSKSVQKKMVSFNKELKSVQHKIDEMKKLEVKAVADEKKAAELYHNIDASHANEALLKEQKKDEDALEALTKSLHDFDKVDAALEARQGEVLFRLDKFKKKYEGEKSKAKSAKKSSSESSAEAGSDEAKKEISDGAAGNKAPQSAVTEAPQSTTLTANEQQTQAAKEILSHRTSLVDAARAKEIEAKRAVKHSGKLLTQAAALLKKRDKEGATKKLAEEEDAEKAVSEAVEKAIKLLTEGQKEDEKLEESMKGISYIVNQQNMQCPSKSLLGRGHAKSLAECHEMCLGDDLCGFVAFWPSGQSSKQMNNVCALYKAPCKPVAVKSGQTNTLYTVMLQGRAVRQESLELQASDLKDNLHFLKDKRAKLNHLIERMSKRSKKGDAHHGSKQDAANEVKHGKGQKGSTKADKHHKSQEKHSKKHEKSHGKRHGSHHDEAHKKHHDKHPKHATQGDAEGATEVEAQQQDVPISSDSGSEAGQEPGSEAVVTDQQSQPEDQLPTQGDAEGATEVQAQQQDVPISSDSGSVAGQEPGSEAVVTDQQSQPEDTLPEGAHEKQDNKHHHDKEKVQKFEDMLTNLAMKASDDKTPEKSQGASAALQATKAPETQKAMKASDDKTPEKSQGASAVLQATKAPETQKSHV